MNWHLNILNGLPLVRESFESRRARIIHGSTSVNHDVAVQSKPSAPRDKLRGFGKRNVDTRR